MTGASNSPTEGAGGNPHCRGAKRRSPNQPHAGATVVTITVFFSPLGRSNTKPQRSYVVRVVLYRNDAETFLPCVSWG